MPSTDRKLELKAKTSVAQTGSQPFVYAKGLKLKTSTCFGHHLPILRRYYTSTILVGIFGILRAYNEDDQVMIETCRGPSFSIN
jgi:hypothetical protein